MSAVDGGDDAPHLIARVEPDEGVETCTISPADADGVDLMSRWITAEGDAFVELGDRR